MKISFWVIFAFFIFGLSSCYRMRPSKGGGQIKSVSARSINPADIALPDGYQIELVTDSLTFPTGIAFDDAGSLFIVESGYAYG
jgi:hypothetical protein